MKNFIYFLREVEFRVIVKEMGDEEKMNTFKQLVKKVYDISKFKFMSKTDLENLNNY